MGCEQKCCVTSGLCFKWWAMPFFLLPSATCQPNTEDSKETGYWTTMWKKPRPLNDLEWDSHSRDSAFGWINLSFSPLPCTQYISKTGKLSSGHSQFSFQSQRKAMPKNVLTTTQLHSSHMLVKQCSKFSMPGFKSTWTRNFQMFKLELEKAEEPAIKLPTSSGSQKK